MPKHSATEVVIAIKLPIAVEVADGRDKDSDSRIVVACPVVS